MIPRSYSEIATDYLKEKLAPVWELMPHDVQEELAEPWREMQNDEEFQLAKREFWWQFKMLRYFLSRLRANREAE